MPLDHARAPALLDDRPGEAAAAALWGVATETGDLTDVLLCAPAFLELVPCNSVSRESIGKGLLISPWLAARQHQVLVAALEQHGVRCHFVPPSVGLADLCFTRDAVLMSPWGLIELRPAAPHRRAEPAHVASAAAVLGVPHFDRIVEGSIEGGDICLLREGVVVIGRSGDRTDERGARALGALFQGRGWDVIHTRFDRRFLHLDTLFTMVSNDCAVACDGALEDDFLERVGGLGIGIVRASADEVGGLGANLLSLGNRRLIAPRRNERLNAILAGCGFELIALDLDQFTRCGGGAHCLTMPLARRSALSD